MPILFAANNRPAVRHMYNLTARAYTHKKDNKREKLTSSVRAPHEFRLVCEFKLYIKLENVVVISRCKVAFYIIYKQNGFRQMYIVYPECSRLRSMPESR